MKIEFFDIQCRECNGEGETSTGPSCFKNASDCCGGCYETSRCERCNGTGEVNVKFDEQLITDILENLIYNDTAKALELINDKIQFDEH